VKVKVMGAKIFCTNVRPICR